MLSDFNEIKQVFEVKEMESLVAEALDSISKDLCISVQGKS